MGSYDDAVKRCTEMLQEIEKLLANMEKALPDLLDETSAEYEDAFLLVIARLNTLYVRYLKRQRAAAEVRREDCE